VRLSGIGVGNFTDRPTDSLTGIDAVNHMVVMVQENRSFDTYSGQLPAYWVANGFPVQHLDAMPANTPNRRSRRKNYVSHTVADYTGC
jgi:phospholipase C